MRVGKGFTDSRGHFNIQTTESSGDWIAKVKKQKFAPFHLQGRALEDPLGGLGPAARAASATVEIPRRSGSMPQTALHGKARKLMSKVRSRLSYANVVSTLCLILVVGGGAAYAADTVGSEDIINGQVKSPDIGNNQVRSSRRAGRGS